MASLNMSLAVKLAYTSWLGQASKTVSPSSLITQRCTSRVSTPNRSSSR
jgi:hypothetical protein